MPVMRPLPHTAEAGLTLVSLGFLFAPGLDVIAKWLTQSHSPAMVGLMRFVAQASLLLPLMLLFGHTSRPRVGHMAGGILLGTALLTINAALEVMPVANAIAIFFVEPFILTLLSALILKESIGWRRIAAVAVGLAGALILLRPNLAAYGPAAAWPLATALCFALYILVTRVMSMGGRLLGLQFWTSSVAALYLAALIGWGDGAGIALLEATAPGMQELPLILGMGVIGVAGHQMLAHGLARVQASVVAPMQYLEIVSATGLGWMVFGDFPDAFTWLGTAIIVGAGIYVFHRERRVRTVLS